MVTEDGKFVGQEPNPDHPTGVALCVKGRAAPEIVYRPERQLFPLMRTRPKGDPDPGWKRITWDEALDRVAQSLGRIRSESGPEAVAFSWTTPSGTPISDSIQWVERFTNAFGTPNIAYGVEVCNWHKDFAHAYTFGRSIASPDFEKTGCVVLWGHNPSATWLDHATATAAAGNRGAKIIVVDPRRAGFASRADQWLRVRPGSDGALALGIAREMISNGWFDKEFMTRWSNGPFLVRMDTMRFLRADDLVSGAVAGNIVEDTLVAQSDSGSLMGYGRESRIYLDESNPRLFSSVEVETRSGEKIQCKSAFQLYWELCEKYTPDVVERLCWVPRTQITDTARMVYEAKRVCYYMWTGTGQHTNATQTDRAIAILMALTGSFDAEGGNVEFARPPSNDVTGAGLLGAEQRAKCLELEHSPLGPGRNAWVTSETLYRSILDGEPYRVRGMLGFGRNFLVTHGNVARGEEAFKKLEFYAHADVVVSPTAAFADIFLPVNTPWEREALRIGFEGSQKAESHIQFRQAVIPSRGESRSDAQIAFELASRLGLGNLFWDGSIEAGMNYMLEPLKLTVDELRRRPNGIRLNLDTRYQKYRQSGFKTHTGKVEVFSEVFRDAGQNPLPEFVEPARSPMRGDSADFPLVLTSAKVVQFCHSQHRDIPSLRKRSPDPEVQLHPDAAGERGIEDGMLVEVKTHLGAVRMRAKLDAALDPRVVWAQYGWWAGNQTLGLPAANPFSEEGANLNRLISDEATDPVSGSVGHRSYLCDVVAVLTDGERGWIGWREFRIATTHLEADGVMSFVLRPVDNKPVPPFRGGQHINIRTRGTDGAAVVRCYSLSGAEDEESYRISVKLARDSEGRNGQMSGLLHGLSPGDRVELQAPKGKFHLPVNNGKVELERPAVLIAGGIGITPFISMLYQLRKQGNETPVRLAYGVRSGRDHAFRDEIRDLKESMPNLQVVTFYGVVEECDRKGSCFEFEGNISVDALLADHGTQADFFLCGPPIMVEIMTDALRRAGVAKERIHLEAFGPSSRKETLEHNGPQLVTLSRSEKSVTWDPSAGSLLDQLEKTGAQLSSGCRTGQCESCIMRLVDGEVVHPDGTAPVDADHCLPCVAVPLTPVTLEG
jgi:anaerobic selenocysteine-containing dehydrogenase/ferredoxin-NADP reductase